MENDKLDSLKRYYEQCMGIFREDCEWINPKNQFPIMWFGNMKKYMESNCKVVTVASRPSVEEYQMCGSSFLRFQYKDKQEAQDNFDIYLEQMNRYFEREPYSWFNRFNKITAPLGSSYNAYMKDTPPGTSLHIDFVPVGDSNWDEDIDYLLHRYKDHLRTMLNILSPDIAIFSVNQKLMSRICLNLLAQAPHFEALKNTNNKYIRCYRTNDFMNVDKQGSKLLVWGKSMSLPFGYLSNDDIQSSMPEVYNFYKNMECR